MTENPSFEEEEEESTLTPLQQDINDAIEKNPSSDDRTIAQIVFLKNHPGEKWEGKDPSFQYVMKLRKRIAILSRPPEIKVEKEKPVEIPEIPEEEKEKPISEQFAPPLEEVEEKPQVEGLEPEDVSFIVTFTFDKIAEWTNYQGWRLDPKNRNDQRFLDLTAKMIDKYSPQILSEYFLEFMFCYTAIMTIAPKVKGYMDQRKKKEPIIKEPEKTPEPEKILETKEEPSKDETKGATELLGRLK